MAFKIPHWHHLHRTEKTELTSSADKSGLPPGTLIHIGEVHQPESSISITRYNRETYYQNDNASIADLSLSNDINLITWINIEGLSDINIVEKIGNQFSIHPLVLEDILSTHQRPKYEEYEEFLYLIIKGIQLKTDTVFKPRYEQISIILKENFVITFKEKTDDVFKPICNRLKNPKGRLRQYGSDYLTYVILDTVVDEYFVVEDGLDAIFDPLEENLFTQPGREILENIQLIRRELIVMKRNISPLRELMINIERSDTKLIKKKTLRYFDDVHDHVLRVLDSLDSYRERIAAMQDLYLSSISNKMNETMKVLTIFASIFIPLTFIAGIYGMNFEYMPELKWQWAYPSLWLLFIIIGVSLILFFKRRKWL